MNREELRQGLKRLLTENLELPEAAKRETLDDSLRLNADLYVDSVRLLQLIVYIEEELKLAVPEEELDFQGLDTVGALLDFMAELRPLDAAGQGV
ncbi:phosphopantetheine-binding protein [Paenibacillus sp. S-38]|uniref:phosphopantetheine-binding protein n=1 Tax=Paenibacillus sp. S-38 TaxID=3416710 RepID=UPI003CF3EFE0